MSKLELTHYERRKLQQQLHETTNARLFRRVLAVLQIDQGKTVSEVARLLQVSEQSIYNWIDRFRADRPAAQLMDQPRSGRPTLWTEERQACLRALLDATPEQCGYFANDWTVPLLREQLRHGTGQDFADDTLRRELHRLGYVWKRGRYRLDADPELGKKTVDSPPRTESAAPERAARRRRNRLAAVPAAAGRLVVAGSTAGDPH
jgi:transposase